MFVHKNDSDSFELKPVPTEGIHSFNQKQTKNVLRIWQTFNRHLTRIVWANYRAKQTSTPVHSKFEKVMAIVNFQQAMKMEIETTTSS